MLTLNIDTALVSQELCEGFPTESRRRYSRIFSIALPTISATVVALRCFARFTVTHKLWWDDWTALIALVSRQTLSEFAERLRARADYCSSFSSYPAPAGLQVSAFFPRGLLLVHLGSWNSLLTHLVNGRRGHGLWGTLLGRRTGQGENDPPGWSAPGATHCPLLTAGCSCSTRCRCSISSCSNHAQLYKHSSMPLKLTEVIG